MEEGKSNSAARRKEWAAPLFVFILALSIRAVYIYFLRRTIIWDAMMVDAELYDTWGLRIAAGDWLGQKIFYDPPLYAYFLGIVYKLFGHDYLILRIIQIFIGSIHAIIIFFLGKTIFDFRAGLIAGVFAAVYGPFVYYDALLMKAFMDSTLVDLSLLAVLIALRTGKLRWWFVHGISLGLASLLRVNLLAFAALEILIFSGRLIFVSGREPKTKALLASIVWGIGIGLALLPVMYRNYHISGKFVLVSSYLGQNFYTGNNPDNMSGNYERVPFVRANSKYEEEDFYREAAQRLGRVDLTPEEVSRYWFREAMLYIEAQPDAFVKRLWLRFRIYWNSYEVPDSYSMSYIGRNMMPMLRAMPGLGIAAPLGMLGVILTWRRRRELWPLYIFIFVYMCTVIAFFVFSRYRLASVGVLIAFGGAALSILAGSNRRDILKVSAIFIILLFAVNLPAPVKVPDSEVLRNFGTLYRQRGDFDKAVAFYRKAIKLDPSEYQTRYFFAFTLREMGKCQEAISEYRAALKIMPDDPNSNAGIGMCYESWGDDENAKQYYLKSLGVDPRLIDVRLKLINLYAKSGDRAAALEHIEILKKLDPDNIEAESIWKKLQ